MLAPRHLRHVNKTLYARRNLNECTVVCNDDNLSFDMVVHFKVGRKSLPRMRSKLFETQCNTFFLVVKVKNDNVNLLVERHNFTRIVYASPRQICNMNKSVNAAKVNKHAVRGDVLHRSFKYLTFLQFGNDCFLILFEFRLDECLV